MPSCASEESEELPAVRYGTGPVRAARCRAEGMRHLQSSSREEVLKGYSTSNGGKGRVTGGARTGQGMQNKNGVNAVRLSIY